MEFRWIEWNVDHIAEHGVTPEEAERVVVAVRPPYPQDIGDEKWLVIGRGTGDRFVQVIYVVDDGGTLFVVHARPSTQSEKRRYRRRRR